jgi:hypothetical protein
MLEVLGRTEFGVDLVKVGRVVAMIAFWQVRRYLKRRGNGFRVRDRLDMFLLDSSPLQD